MSPIPRLHRQVLGTLLSAFLFALTFFFQTGYTGSNETSATAIFLLVSLLVLARAKYGVETAFSLSFALVQVVDWCTIVRRATLTSWILINLVDLYTSPYPQAQIFVAKILKTVDLAVELLTIRLFSAYLVKSEPLEKGLLTPEGHSPSPPEPLDRSFFAPTSDETLLEEVVPADVGPTATTVSSSKPSRGSQGGLLPASSPIGTAAPSARVLGKSSIVFPSFPNASTDSNSVVQVGPDVLPTEITLPPKRTRKLALKRFDFANLVKLREPVVAAVAPRPSRSPLPRIIVHEDLSDSALTSSNSPIFTTTTAASSARTSSSKPAPPTHRSPLLDLQSDFEPETAGLPEPPTNASGTGPNIVIREDLQDSLRSSSYPLGATTIAASFAHSTPPTSQTAALNSRSNSTVGTTDSDVEWETEADPTGSTGLLLTPPQASIVNGRFPDLASNCSNSPNASSTASSFAFSSSTATLPTPATTTPCSTLIDLRSDLEREADAENPTSIPDTTAGIELPKIEDVDRVTAGNPQEEEVHVVDHHRRDSGGRTNLFEFDEVDEVTDDDYRWKWTKREGKLPEGGRLRPWTRPDLETAMPTSMTTTLAPLVASQTEDDELDDEGSRKGDVEKAILMSLGLPPVDPTPLDGTSPDTVIDHQLGRSFNRGLAIETPATSPRVVVSETEDDEVDDHGFSRAELAQVTIAESTQGASLGFANNPPGLDGRPPVSPSSISTTSTLVETDDEKDDDVDDKGFSKKDQRKAMVESRDAATERPFYGASTSSAGDQPLSQKEWDILEQYVAVPSNPKKVVRPPSPASTHVDTELMVPSSLPLPPPLPEATAPVKTKRLPRLGKFIKKVIPRNPFKNRNRGEAH